MSRRIGTRGYPKLCLSQYCGTEYAKKSLVVIIAAISTTKMEFIVKNSLSAHYSTSLTRLH